MEEKNTIKISSKLYKDINSYCDINKLILEDYVSSLLKRAFMEDKYGKAPIIKEAPKTSEMALILAKEEEKKSEVKTVVVKTTNSNNKVKEKNSNVEKVNSGNTEDNVFSTPKKRVLN